MGTQDVVAHDPASKQMLLHVQRIAPSDASVLIIGESGTGKEVMARQVHRLSGRRGPFVAVNCGALTPALAEAELFGHEAGSFTGALGQRAGWFEAADKGTLLLDEISELPAELQVKILRVLQQREVTRVGSRRPKPIDVRLIAATNVDLADAVARGRFRADLFYRLNVATISLAPLRERRADILPLADHFLAIHGARLLGATASFMPSTQRALLDYHWPGNIRELENVIHSALLSSVDGVIRPEHLRFSASRTRTGHGAEQSASSASDGTPARTLDELLASALAAPLDLLLQAEPLGLFPRVEEFLIRRAWSHCRGNSLRAARLLGVPGPVMRAHLRRYGLSDASADTPSLFTPSGEFT